MYKILAAIAAAGMLLAVSATAASAAPQRQDSGIHKRARSSARNAAIGATMLAVTSHRGLTATAPIQITAIRLTATATRTPMAIRTATAITLRVPSSGSAHSVCGGDGGEQHRRRACAVR